MVLCPVPSPFWTTLNRRETLCLEKFTHRLYCLKSLYLTSPVTTHPTLRPQIAYLDELSHFQHLYDIYRRTSVSRTTVILALCTTIRRRDNHECFATHASCNKDRAQRDLNSHSSLQVTMRHRAISTLVVYDERQKAAGERWARQISARRCLSQSLYRPKSLKEHVLIAQRIDSNNFKSYGQVRRCLDFPHVSQNQTFAGDTLGRRWQAI